MASLMKEPLLRLPDLHSLTAGVNAVMAGNGSGIPRMTIVDRSPVVFASTYPSEIVTCRSEEFGELKLYCKYFAGLDYDSYGHRGGVHYEAEVYRGVLGSLPVSVPRFYGAYQDRAVGETWLILEYLDNTLRLGKGPQPESILRAARWIGCFHSVSEARVRHSGSSILNTYTADYYQGWVRRTSLFAQSLHTRFPWLKGLCERAGELITILLGAPPAIIHGEYYPHNILIRGDEIYPIDWESAAIGAGEIDLATLSDGWTNEITRQCESEYQKARWPHGCPPGFEERLAAARAYLCFRWLGDQPHWTLSESNYFEQLRSAGRQLGIT